MFKIDETRCQIPRQGRRKFLPTQFSGRLGSFHLAPRHRQTFRPRILLFLFCHNPTLPSRQHRTLPSISPRQRHLQPTIAARHGRQPLRVDAAIPANIGVQDEGSRDRTFDDGAPARHHASGRRRRARKANGSQSRGHISEAPQPRPCQFQTSSPLHVAEVPQAVQPRCVRVPVPPIHLPSISSGAVYQLFLSPDAVPSFPLAKEIESESAAQSVCPRAPSTEYKAYHDRRILEERQRAAKQEWQVIKSNVVEDLPPPVATQIPSNDTPKTGSNKPSASNTLASPAVTKLQGSDLPKPSAKKSSASNTPASPAVTKVQGNGIPKPSANPAVPPTSLAFPTATKPQKKDTPNPSIKETGEPWVDMDQFMIEFMGPRGRQPSPKFNRPNAPPNTGHLGSSVQTIPSGEVVLEQSDGSPFVARGRGRGRGRKFHPYD